MFKFHFFITLIFITFINNALANDTTAVITPSGIEYKKNDLIKIKEEILKISLDKIEVNYIFFNESDKDITVDVAFPLPPTPLDNENDTNRVFPSWDEAYHAYTLLEQNPAAFKNKFFGGNISLGRMLSDAAFINFNRTINDEEYGFNYRIIARKADGTDITQLLQSHNIPLSTAFLNGFMDESVLEHYPQWKKTLKKLGLLTKEEKANWQNQTIYFWQMTFPAKQDTKVSHSYRPHPGILHIQLEDN